MIAHDLFLELAGGGLAKGRDRYRPIPIYTIPLSFSEMLIGAMGFQFYLVDAKGLGLGPN
jgi:hypothetical protein